MSNGSRDRYGRNVAVALAGAALCWIGCDNTPPLSSGDSLTTKPGPGDTGAAVTKDPSPTNAPVEPTVVATCPAMAVADPNAPLSTQNSPGCRCTRRPGPGQSFECAVGANESTSAVIGPEGGSLELMGQQGHSSGVAFRITFPPGALAQPTTIKVTETSVPPPTELVDYSPVYLVEPRALALAKLAAVRVPWGSTSGYVSQGLAIEARDENDGCRFAPLGDNYVNAGFNQGSVDHLGYMFVGAPRTSAEASCP